MHMQLPNIKNKNTKIASVFSLLFSITQWKTYKELLLFSFVIKMSLKWERLLDQNDKKKNRYEHERS